MSVFEFIYIDFVAEWEQHKGGKLLAHPFDSNTQNPMAHKAIKELIFTAASEITKSLEVEVSAPKVSEEAARAGHTLSIFLIYNLTEDQVQLFLQ